MNQDVRNISFNDDDDDDIFDAIQPTSKDEVQARAAAAKSATIPEGWDRQSRPVKSSSPDGRRHRAPKTRRTAQFGTKIDPAVLDEFYAALDVTGQKVVEAVEDMMRDYTKKASKIR